MWNNKKEEKTKQEKVNKKRGGKRVKKTINKQSRQKGHNAREKTSQLWSDVPQVSENQLPELKTENLL